jgi:predicted Fe-S protein YdhL (DUF1289 family)
VSDWGALVLQRLQGEIAALAPGEPVPTPCNSVCRIDPATGWCEGCLRTLDEIAAWRSLDGEARLAVWRELGGRAERPAGGGGPA